MKKTLALLIFVTILIFISIFSKIPNDSFLFIHDEYLVFTKDEALNSFFVRSSNDLGYSTFSIILVTFWDRVLYLVLYYLGLSLPYVSKVSYLIKFLLITVLPFFGFKKIIEHMGKVDWLSLFFLSLFYAFGSFPLVYWHGNGFSLSLLIFYSLAPLAFWYVIEICRRELALIELISFVILLFFMSFGFYIYLVFIFVSFLYVLFLGRNKFFVTNLVKLFLLFLPFISLLWLIVYDMFFTSVQNVNFSGGETYNQIRGGFLYPLFQWFSWGIYTIWTPRSIFTFYEYLQGPFYILPLVGMYIYIGYLSYKYKFCRFFYILLGIMLFVLLLVKGSQPPFNDLYLYLVENVAIFRVFRSPDNKFGFGVFFVFTLIISYVVSKYYSFRVRHKVLFVGFLSIFVLSQVWVFISSRGLIGEDSSVSSDRVVSIPENYTSLANFINRLPYGYIITSPESDFSYFSIGEDRHFGQDILPKIIFKPFIYTNEHSSISKDASLIIKDAIQSADYTKTPIKYYLLRKDNILKLKPEIIPGDWPLLYSDSTFSLYSVLESMEVISSTSPIRFEYKSPILFKIVTTTGNSQNITLNENYSLGWGLLGGNSVLKASRVEASDYGNYWELEASEVSREMMLYYEPQNYLYLGIIISLVYLLLLVIARLVFWLRS